MRRTYTRGSFKGYPVNSNYPLIPNRLKAIEKLLDAARRDHNRLLVCGFTLNLPSTFEFYTTQEHLLDDFKRRMARRWDQEQRGRLHFVCCVEQDSSINPHWHIYYIVDDKHTQRHRLEMLVDECWNLALELPVISRQGYAHSCGFRVVRKYNQEELNDTFYWLSYAAKDNKIATRGSFSTSRT